jgi:hypothetical protein
MTFISGALYRNNENGKRDFFVKKEKKIVRFLIIKVKSNPTDR